MTCTHLTDCLVGKTLCQDIMDGMQVQCLFHFRERAYEDVEECSEDEQALAQPVLLRQAHRQVVSMRPGYTSGTPLYE